MSLAYKLLFLIEELFADGGAGCLGFLGQQKHVLARFSAICLSSWPPLVLDVTLVLVIIPYE